MFVVRRAKMEDQSTLLKMARMVHFINLPPDQTIIGDKITNSRSSFMRAAGNKKAAVRRVHAGSGGLSEMTAKTDLFMFVLEDTTSPGCLGTSQLVAKMGGKGDPNVCFKLEIREKFSTSLKTGTKTVVARVHLDESGPTEIGGLILQPSFRGHPLKLGRLISQVRFHFIGLHRAMFRDEILAEMMAPITHDGQNLLWEYLGRRFIPLSYTEADRFCQHSREFMTALLPQGDIHLSLLPPEARALVGEVGPETVGARRLLERIGFEYHHFVDPFDGGPYLTAKTDSLELVKSTKNSRLGEPITVSRAKGFGIVSTLDHDGEFLAVETQFLVEGRKIRITREAMHALQVAPGDRVGYTPTTPVKRKKSATTKPARKKTASKKKTTARKGASKPRKRAS